jgi:hypothetical protein
MLELVAFGFGSGLHIAPLKELVDIGVVCVVLIFHTISIMPDEGTFKKKKWNSS